MWKTVILLLFTLIVLPTAAYYLDTQPTEEQWILIKRLFWVYAIAAGSCFVLSVITKNHSQVDKVWSIIPLAYAWIVYAEHPEDMRILVMAILVSFWGIRLTLNFGRRGGYSWKFWTGEEDYRWSVLQQRKEFKNPIAWLAFNLLFISFYQMGLILLFTFPIVKSVGGTNPFGVWDIVVAILMAALVIVELVADNQQWKYQTEKYRRKNNGEDLGEYYGKGFVHTGLWKIVRHPNYASEQAIWIVFYFFSVAATGLWINWSVVGCMLLVILFKGSSDFSEGISIEKYPEYKDYIKKTPRFVPFTKFNRK